MIPAYTIVLAKNGPKLSAIDRVTVNGAAKQATSEREAPPGWTMARLANYLASTRGVQRPVVDRTMLNGTYGFTLNYAIGDGRPHRYLHCLARTTRSEATSNKNTD
jgi:uncharacterized protein (TIGR03435 family)